MCKIPVKFCISKLDESIVKDWTIVCNFFLNEAVCEKNNNLDSYQVGHKPGCTVSEDS